MTTDASVGFSGFRRLFWPIHQSELKKFFPMLLIYSLIVFNYSLLRTIKDSLVITAPKAGAVSIPFLKVWAVLPMAFLSTLIFTRLANRYNRDTVFYIIMAAFLAFFFLFAFILYPCQEYLHPHGLADYFQSILPGGFQGLISTFRNWTFTLFYVMSELWGTLIMSVLFWGLANEVCNVKEASRFYAIFGIGANLGTTFAGAFGWMLSSELIHKMLPSTGDRWEQNLMLTATLVISVGVFTLFLYRWLTKNGLEDHRELSNDAAHSNLPKKEKVKMGIRKNIAYLARSKYLLCIAAIVLTYNISLNMIEVVWKDEVHKLCPYGADYNLYQSKVLMFIGLTSTVFSVFLCGQVIRRFGWTIAALVTPVILSITGALFFSFALGKETTFAMGFAAMLGTTPLALSAFFGSMQNCFSRASKFTFFDVTKEISFIPLSSECKLKGKAAIDGVGSRIGKSGGSLFHSLLLVCFGSIGVSTPFIAGLLFLVFLTWILSIRSLGRQFKELSEEKALEEVAEEKAPLEEKFSNAPKPSRASGKLAEGVSPAR